MSKSSHRHSWQWRRSWRCDVIHKISKLNLYAVVALDWRRRRQLWAARAHHQIRMLLLLPDMGNWRLMENFRIVNDCILRIYHFHTRTHRTRLNHFHSFEFQMVLSEWANRKTEMPCNREHIKRRNYLLALQWGVDFGIGFDAHRHRLIVQIYTIKFRMQCLIWISRIADDFAISHQHASRECCCSSDSVSITAKCESWGGEEERRGGEEWKLCSLHP